MNPNDKPKKRRSGKRAPDADPSEACLRKIAKEGAGKPPFASLAEGAPLKELIGRFVGIALEEEMRDRSQVRIHLPDKGPEHPNT